MMIHMLIDNQSASQYFLEAVWDITDLDTYYFLAQKLDGWQDIPKRGDVDAPENNQEVYFCPYGFTKPRRQSSFAKPAQWLHADLDEAPHEWPDQLRPSAIWETSPGRYQAIWDLKRSVTPEVHARLNQKLNYFLNADPGGWSITKVLRLPGSVSIKHGSPWDIEVPRIDLYDYDPREIWNLVKHISTDRIVIGGRVDVGSTKEARRIMRGLPTRARSLVRSKNAQDRSKHVFRLAATLREHGLTAQDTTTVLMLSPVAREKYGVRMKEELARVSAKVYAKDSMSPNKKPGPKTKKVVEDQDEDFGTQLEYDTVEQFMVKKFKSPSWLIDGIWSDEAHGIIAGEEKSFKSLIALDLAVSVGSGTRFLNHFEVPEAGPVMYVQQENKPGFVRERLTKIMTERGLHGKGKANMKTGSIELDLPSLDLMLMYNRRVNFKNPYHLEYFRKVIEQRQLKLIIFDPLYLMIADADENSSQQMVDILGELLAIKQEYNCGILVLHHYKKPSQDNPVFGKAAKISGTGAFGRWYESLLLIEKTNDPNTVTLLPQHREAESSSTGIKVTFEDLTTGYKVLVDDMRESRANLFDAIRLVLANNGEKMTVSELSKSLEINRPTLERRLAEMDDVVVGKSTRGRSAIVSLNTEVR